jgi:hypothetical protein
MRCLASGPGAARSRHVGVVVQVHVRDQGWQVEPATAPVYLREGREQEQLA